MWYYGISKKACHQEVRTQKKNTVADHLSREFSSNTGRKLKCNYFLEMPDMFKIFPEVNLEIIRTQNLPKKMTFLTCKYACVCLPEGKKCQVFRKFSYVLNV